MTLEHPIDINLEIKELKAKIGQTQNLEEVTALKQQLDDLEGQGLRQKISLGNLLRKAKKAGQVFDKTHVARKDID